MMSIRFNSIAAVAGLICALLAGCAEAPRGEPAAASERERLADIVQLTSGFSRAGEAYFSPDMKWIIFQATPEGEQHYQMYVAQVRWRGKRIAGTEPPIRISPENSRNTCGFFAPDGGSLIFASTAGKEQPEEAAGGYQREGRSYRWAFPAGMEIFRADDWLSAVRDVAAGGAAGAVSQVNLATRALTDNEVYDAEGAFSPDGRWICYTSGAGADADVYVMEADGAGRVQITSVAGYDGGPFFSPDGQRLVYRSDRRGNDLLQVFIAELAFDAQGKIAGLARERQLTDDANVNWGPFWHPDGMHIVYATSAHGHHNYEVYLMRDDGSGKKRITYKEGADVLPVFSPDGKWLMWTSKRTSDGTTQVFAARFTMSVER